MSLAKDCCYWNKKSKNGALKYKEFLSEENAGNEEDEDKKSEDTSGSYETSVPQSRKAVVDLLKTIISPNAIQNLTSERFLIETDLYETVKAYFDDVRFFSSQLNDWIGKEGFWCSTKKRAIDGQRVRSRTVHLVEQELRGFL
ncbi:hypothetical protein RMATCC62417_14253 [Rhizopus microsporus]|nr:hypothetical protein RMATCC62417_14253 [Rhizopus microsporus]